MFRQALLAAILVSGTAAAAAAQSDEFPFRRLGSRDWAFPRFEMRPYRFSMRDNERVRARVDRLRVRLEERSHDMADRARLRGFDSRELALRMQNRAFVMRDDMRRHQMEFRSRDMDRVRDRIRDRMDHFRFERPLIMRRHSRTI
jgi:hypothetical protein